MYLGNGILISENGTDVQYHALNFESKKYEVFWSWYLLSNIKKTYLENSTIKITIQISHETRKLFREIVQHFRTFYWPPLWPSFIQIWKLCWKKLFKYASNNMRQKIREKLKIQKRIGRKKCIKGTEKGDGISIGKINSKFFL